MAKSSGLNFNLPSVDDLFSTEEERAEARLEKVVNLSPSEISDFPNHPFNVPYGNWVLKELESPEGFILSDEVIPVTVEEDGQVVEISLANERVYGDLRLTKVDKDYPDNKLTGAEFEVYRVGVSNIGYTSTPERKSREGWRFAKQIRPDLD